MRVQRAKVGRGEGFEGGGGGGRRGVRGLESAACKFFKISCLCLCIVLLLSPVKMCWQPAILPPSVNFFPLTPHWTSL